MRVLPSLPVSDLEGRRPLLRSKTEFDDLVANWLFIDSTSGGTDEKDVCYARECTNERRDSSLRRMVARDGVTCI